MESSVALANCLADCHDFLDLRFSKGSQHSVVRDRSVNGKTVEGTEMASLPDLSTHNVRIETHFKFWKILILVHLTRI